MSKEERKKYIETLKQIRNYYGVSEQCASYLFHRALRSKKKSHKYMTWYLQLQNAIVTLDKHPDINWKNITFGKEYFILKKYNINISEMSKEISFKWVENYTPDDDWTLVTNKKNNKIYNITEVGLLL